MKTVTERFCSNECRLQLLFNISSWNRNRKKIIIFRFFTKNYTCDVSFLFFYFPRVYMCVCACMQNIDNSSQATMTTWLTQTNFVAVFFSNTIITAIWLTVFWLNWCYEKKFLQGLNTRICIVGFLHNFCWYSWPGPPHPFLIIFDVIERKQRSRFSLSGLQFPIIFCKVRRPKS